MPHNPMTPDDHRTVIEQYRALQSAPGWHNLPDDGYLYSHLAEHLQAAGLHDELRSLFQTDDWLHVRVRQGGYDAWLADLELTNATTRAELEHQLSSGQTPDAFLDIFYHGLLKAHFGTTRRHFAPELVLRAWETGRWSLEQTLSVIRVETRLNQKPYSSLEPLHVLGAWVDALEEHHGLVDALKAECYVRASAIAAYFLARGHADHNHYADALTLVAILRPDDREAFEQAIHANLEALSRDSRKPPHYVRKLWRALPADLLPDVIRRAKQQGLYDVLWLLLDRVDEPTRYDLVETILQQRANSKATVEWGFVPRLAHHAQGTQVERINDLIMGHGGASSPFTLAELIPHLNSEQQRHALQVFSNLEFRYWAMNGLVQIILHGIPELRQLALMEVLKWDSYPARRWACKKLANSPLVPELIAQMTAHLDDIDLEWQYMAALETLDDLRFLSGQARLYDEDGAITPAYRAWLRRQLMIVEFWVPHYQDNDRVRILLDLIPRLPDDLLPQVWWLLRYPIDIGTDSILSALAERTPPEELAPLFRIEHWSQAARYCDAILAFAQAAGGSILEEACTFALARLPMMVPTKYYCRLIARLAPLVRGEQHEPLRQSIRRAIDYCIQIEDVYLVYYEYSSKDLQTAIQRHLTKWLNWIEQGGIAAVPRTILDAREQEKPLPDNWQAIIAELETYGRWTGGFYHAAQRAAPFIGRGNRSGRNRSPA